MSGISAAAPVAVVLGSMLFFRVDEVARPLEYPSVVLEAVTAAECRIVDGLVGSGVFFFELTIEVGILDLVVVDEPGCLGATDACSGWDSAAAAFFEVNGAGALVLSGF